MWLKAAEQPNKRPVWGGGSGATEREEGKGCGCRQRVVSVLNKIIPSLLRELL